MYVCMTIIFALRKYTDYRGKEHYAAIIHNTLGDVFVSTTNTITGRGRNIYSPDHNISTIWVEKSWAYNLTLATNNVKRKHTQTC